MDKPNLNTTYDFTLADGSVVKLTLTFYKLYQLKAKNKKLYDHYNQITNEMQKNFGELGVVQSLYVAYVCANMDEENLLTEEKFIELCGFDRKAISDAYEALTTPKKQQASVNHSRIERTQQNRK